MQVSFIKLLLEDSPEESTEYYGPEFYGPEYYGPEFYGPEYYGPEYYSPEYYGRSSTDPEFRSSILCDMIEIS